MSLVNHTKALLEFSFRQIFKYKMRDIIWPFLVLPTSWVLDILLRGTYVGTVDFYGKVIPYLYLIFLTFLSYDIFTDILNTTFWDLIYNDHLFYYNKISWMVSKIIYWITINLIKVLIAFVPLHFIYKLPIKIFIFSILIGLSIIIFSVAYSLIISFAPLVFRREASPILWSSNSIFFSIIPISYALTIVPLPYRTYLEIFIPFYGLIEEIRKYVILGNFEFHILLSSFLMSLFYLFIGILVFRYFWNYARKTGKIRLA